MNEPGNELLGEVARHFHGRRFDGVRLRRDAGGRYRLTFLFDGDESFGITSETPFRIEVTEIKPNKITP